MLGKIFACACVLAGPTTAHAQFGFPSSPVTQSHYMWNQGKSAKNRLIKVEGNCLQDYTYSLYLSDWEHNKEKLARENLAKQVSHIEKLELVEAQLVRRGACSYVRAVFKKPK